MTIFSGLLCLGTWAVTSSIPVLVSFVSLYGFCSGVFIAVLPAIIAQLTPAWKLGGRIGAFYSVCAIAQLVGSPIGGALIQVKDSGGDGDAHGYLGLILFAVRSHDARCDRILLTCCRVLRSLSGAWLYLVVDCCMIEV
jgi:MCP family monocarboxylic acid transporter-like MFS transporter 10